MEEHIVKILRIEEVTHDVRRFQVEKPEGYYFVPGQATDISINVPELKNMTRPFSFTSLNSDPYLEFIIKIYDFHKGITNDLGNLKPGSELIIREVFGAINFKGKGVFIAGGAGITPFIAILRDLKARNELSGNKLLFANKKKTDIILEAELKNMLKKDFINILSDENADGYFHGMVNEDFLKANITDFTGNFYICGPPLMIKSVLKQLASLGVTKKSVTLEF